jgi:hypothetical protein
LTHKFLPTKPDSTNSSLIRLLKCAENSSFDALAKSTDLIGLRETHLTFPELAFTVSTRAMLGAGIALLLADRLTTEQRKAIGATLTAVGLITTIPIVWTILGKCERA